MSRLAKSFALLLSFAGLLLGATNANALACTSVATGNWGVAGTWTSAGNCNRVPTAADSVTIATGHTVTVNVATANVLSVTVNAGAILTQTRALSTAGALSVAGTLTSNNAVTVTGATTVTGSLNIVGAGARTFTGLVTVTGGTWNNSGNRAVTFRGGITNNGTFTAGTGTQTFNLTQAIGGANPISFGGIVAVVGAITVTNNNTNIVTIAGNLTGSVAGSTWVNAANSTLNYGGAAAPMGTRVFTASAVPNTVNYNGAAAQAVKTANYNNLTVTKPAGIAATTAAGTVNVTGVLTVTSGTLNIAGTTIAVTGATNVSGTLGITSTTGTKTFTGLVTVNAGGVWSNTGNEAVTFRGGITHNGTTFTGGTGTQTFNLTQAIGGASPINFGGIVAVVGAVTVTNNNTNIVTIAGNLTGSAGGSTWVNAANSTLNYGGAAAPMGTRVFTASANSNTVIYSRGGNQTIKVPSGAPATYYHLTLSGSGIKTMPATAMSITGNFTMSGAAGTSATAAAALTVGGNFSVGAGNTFANGANALNVAGNFDQSGTFTAGAGVVTLNGGAAVQTISGAGPLGFANLTINNTGGITLARNVTVTSAIIGAHTLTSTCPTDWTLTSNGGATVEHSCPSTVNSIILANCTSTAATVQWTVTFNESVTGVDATAFSLVPTGLSGAYITTVSGGGTSWTVTANTGIGSGSLGLNQTGPGSVVPTLNGTFTGAVCTITATSALAEYRMDEANWNGTANEVVDSSGSGNHAQAFNSANTTVVTGQEAKPGNPGTCRYGVFDNGGTITQGYVQTPLPDLATDFTITAWIRTTNNAATGQRILIDDQNNTGGYGISLGDGAAGIIRFYSRGITPVILDSTYTIANNTWYFVAAVADITNRIRTIYVYNAAGTLLASTSDAAAFTGTWGTDTGPVSIGGEVNGPPQTEPPLNFHFRGNLDEVRVYQKVLSQTALAAIATQTHTCPIGMPDHLEIQSSGSGLTCAASTLTIKACTDAAVPCVTPYTGGVTGTLSATGTPTVIWDGTTGGAAGAGFVIPAGGSSVTKNVQVATVGSVVFGVSSAAPAPANATTCNFGSPLCTFTASLAGFIFSDTTAPGNPYTIPAQVSGIATPTLYLRAVQASTANPAVCTPAIVGQTTAVNMGYVCNNPVACQAGNLASINAAAIAPGGTSVNLTFDANGSAPITARYDDVGQITLNANKTVTPPNGTAVTLNGNSNPFVVAPHHFGFSGITAGLIKAGNPFSATVTAYNGLATPTATPNFGKESAVEGVTLTSNLGVGNNPAISNNVIPGSEFGAGGMVNDANGVATVNNLSWGEVGLITMTASLTSGSYLGSALTATGTSGNIGRFIPDHFDTVTSGGMPCPTGLTCPAQFNGFVYSGQPFTTNVYARNLAGGTTLNYDSTLGYSRAVTLSAWDAAGGATANPGGGALTVNTIPSASFSMGVATTSTPLYTFTAVPTAPTDIFIRADESLGGDGVTSLRVPANTSVEGGMKIVSGRIRISNAHGSELLPLPIGVIAQYWNGTSYVTSTTDSTSTFANTNVVFANWQKLTPASGWAAGSTSVVTPPASVVFTNGAGSFKLSAPGSGKTGSVDITTNAPSYLPSNTGRATFGVYKGSNEFIYLRENY